jgi:acetoin utilization deacetylase AcuC-like enzyme
MRRTGFVYDERYMRHDTGAFHPETPERIAAVYRGVKASGLLGKLVMIRPEPAALKWVEAIHGPDYIEQFKNACLSGATEFHCADNQMCAESFDTALLAVGGVLGAARCLMEGEIDNAFCAVRPPGHHAEQDRAMGFCYFNNVAVAARYLQTEWGIEKIGLIDFDVHHGNGTQHIFEADPSVFYYSIHQHPSFGYPGTGRDFESGHGAGYGFTKNSPVLPGRGDSDYRRLLEKDLFPAFDSFQPEVILISAGFDAHISDDMSDIKLTTEGFSWIITKVVEMADRYAKGRLISVLEGGYSLENMPELVANHVKILLQE